MPEKMHTIREAINDALREEMARDNRVIIMGEDIGVAGGIFKVTQDLLKEFGPERVIDTPIAEAGIVGLAIGAAMTGLRPVVEIMFSDFTTLASDQIVNQAAKLRYMTGGQCKIPMVIRTAMGAGRRAAAQHSQSLHAWFCHIPGLKVVMPATPADAKGLLKSAIRDENPVMFFEDKMIYNVKGLVPEEDYTIPLGEPKLHRRGDHVTLICTSSMLYPAQEAADILAKESIEIEIFNLRTVSPVNEEQLLESTIKTGRVLVVDEGYRSFGITGEIIARLQEGGFYYLDTPIMRLGAMDVPIPFAPTLEDLTIPTTEDIIETVRNMVG
ncbi:MAG: alpha-ketoacid dehydrogenase subunit beta [Anaerolineales bacterium]|jgi:pyruvate dehydrogenase E1 component beta subunit